MRAAEITNEWSNTNPGIRNALEKKGYQYLGAGLDQTAYLEPSTGQVLKIFGADDEGRTQNPGHKMFETWVAYCQANAGNPFLPKFSGWKKFEFGGETYLQIRMERLDKFPYRWEEGLEVLSIAVDAGIPLETIFGYVGNDSNGPHGQGNLRVVTLRIEMINELVLHLGEEGMTQLYNTMKELHDIGRRSGWHWDLHYGNFMIRNDGTPVIVDPWVA